uniref:CMGC/GSK protein kinase n=1 Tax=Wuchereria bancrofti TaxID=6293 RepID=A0AAF5PQB7_WUCBA
MSNNSFRKKAWSEICVEKDVEILLKNMDLIHEQSAVELPSKKKVKLRMKNLRLHSSGVFSNVYRGTLLSPGPCKEIALKKTWPDFEEDSQVNTELDILLGLSCRRHKNIIQVLYTFRSITPDNKIFLPYPSLLNYICETMIFEYLPKTMSNIVKQIGGKYPDYIEIKLYSWQLFNGLSFLSNNHVCHRDIKPQNLLIEPISGMLKIADFGSAKFMRRMTKSTFYQVTRYYRPPELLLKATFYSPQVDVWSGGCVLGEITKGSILFPGKDTKDQFKLVMDALGSPDETDLMDMKAAISIAGGRIAPRGLRSILPYASEEIINILQRILVYSPEKRLCGKVFLSDPFFQELFVPNKRRTNGTFVSNIITLDDLQKIPYVFLIFNFAKKLVTAIFC